MKLTFSFLFAFSILTGAGARISGTIIDPSSRPVPGAVVECGSARATTGDDGRFAFDSSSCEATITKDGFETQQLKLEPGGERRIALRIAKLNERVVVSATRTPTTIEEAGVSANVLTQGDLEARQYQPVFDMLRELPGLTVIATGRRGGLTGVFTRGAQRTGTLFLLDGIPLNEPGGEMNVAQLSSGGIERIEVVRGPESPLFGAEAAAGVVQLFTARGSSETNVPHGSLSYERGNMKTDRWIANLNGGLASRLDYSLTGEQFHSIGMFPNDYFRNTLGTANLGFRIAESTQLRGVFREFDSIAGNPNLTGFGIFDRDANGEDRDSALSLRLDDTRGSRYVQRLAFGYHRLRDRFNDSFADGPFQISAYVKREAADRVYLVGPGEGTLVTSTQSTFPFPGLTISDRKNLDYQGTVNHSGGALTFGYEFERQGGLISLTDVTRTNNGGFIHEQYSVGGRLFLTGGARLERSSTYGNKFAPRGSATWKLRPGTFVRASAGRGITEPSLLQNFARESFYVGNPNLKPEKTTTLDAGIVQEFGSRIRGEVTFFRNAFEDLIAFDSSNFPSTWSNIDRSWARGIEVSATVRPHRYVQAFVGYTHMNTKITRAASSVGWELPRRARNFGSTWISFAPRRWNLMAGGRFLGERRDSDFVFGANRNQAYAVMFVSGSVRLTKHISPFFRLDNALDERYMEALGYTSLSRNGVAGVRVSW